MTIYLSQYLDLSLKVGLLECVLTPLNEFKVMKLHEGTQKYRRSLKTFISLLQIVLTELENFQTPLKAF